MAQLSTVNPTIVPALPEAWVRRIFQRFHERYGNAWADKFSGVPMDNLIATWAEDLGDLTENDIKRGLMATRANKFPPSLPEFYSLCKDEIGFDYYAAFIEAVEQIHKRTTGDDKWSHPAIYWAAVVIGTFDLRNATWSAIEKRWTTTLKNELAKGQWPDVPENVPALPAPGKTALTNEQVKAHMAMLRAAVPGMFR